MSDHSQPSSTAAPILRAYCTLITSDDFVLGVRVLAHSLRSVNSLYPLYVLLTPNLSQASRVALASSGCHLIVVAPLAHANNGVHVSSWVDVGYTKLRIWQLTQFERICFLDADVVVRRNIDFLLSDNLDSINFAAAPDTFPPDRFNAGVMLLRPSHRVFNSMVRAMSRLKSYDGGDTGFLNHYFDGWYSATCSIIAPTRLVATSGTSNISLSSEVRPSEYRSHLARLSFGFNALRTMQWFTKKNPRYWEEVDPLYVVHYCSSPKPWEGLEANDMKPLPKEMVRGGFLEQQWMEAYSEMKSKEVEVKESSSALIAELPLEFISTDAGQLKPTLETQLRVENMQPFPALQTMVAEEIERMPLEEFRWHQENEGSTHKDDKLTANTSSEQSLRRRDPSGAVRSITRRGVWVSAEREDRFIELARLSLQVCVLDALEKRIPTCRQSEGIPLKIHQIWFGGKVPSQFHAWMESWKQNHSEQKGWEYTLWTDEDLHKFPLCASLTDASSLFLASHIKSLLPRCTSPAQLSDILRLDILWTLGGLYIDTDFECFADFSPFHKGGAWSKHMEFYAGFSNVGVVEINNGILASIPQHGLVGKLIQNIDIPVLNNQSGSNISTASSSASSSSSSSVPAPSLSSSTLFSSTSAADTAARHSAMQIISSTGPGYFTQLCVKYLEEWVDKLNAAQMQVKSEPAHPITAMTTSTPAQISTDATHKSAVPHHSQSEGHCGGSSSQPCHASSVPPVFLFPTQVFYPLPNNMRHLTAWKDKAAFMTPATFAMHHWSCSWQDKEGNKQASTTAQQQADLKKRQEDIKVLNSLVNSIQKLNADASASPTSPYPISSPSASPVSVETSSSALNPASGLDPRLLGKIAAFLK